MTPTGGWVKKQIGGKPSRESHRDALALENERIAEYHRELKRETEARHPEWFEREPELRGVRAGRWGELA